MMNVFFSNQKTPVCIVFTALHANASLMPSSYEEIYKDQFFWSTKVSVSYGFVCVVLPLFKVSKCKWTFESISIEVPVLLTLTLLTNWDVEYLY